MPVAPDRRSEIAREQESAALGRFLRIVGGVPVSGQQDVGKDQPKAGVGPILPGPPTYIHNCPSLRGEGARLVSGV